MIEYPNGAVEGYHDTDDEESDSNNGQRVLVAEANGKHRRGKFPGCGIEGIAEPVRDQTPDIPLAVFFSDWVEVCRVFPSIAATMEETNVRFADSPLLLQRVSSSGLENAEWTCSTRKCGRLI